MLISDKQQEANRENAQHSTGPTSEAGKAAVRLNALTYGLRARDLILCGENPEDYQQLWADLEAEWQPQTRTERLHLEQISTSQWLLARMARGEARIYEADLPIEKQFALLKCVSAQRAHLERSSRHAMQDLQQLQKERRARPQPQPAQPAKSAPAAPPPVPHPDYVMSEGADAHAAVFCAPATPDTR